MESEFHAVLLNAFGITMVYVSPSFFKQEVLRSFFATFNTIDGIDCRHGVFLLRWSQHHGKNAIRQ